MWKRRFLIEWIKENKRIGDSITINWMRLDKAKKKSHIKNEPSDEKKDTPR